MELTGRVIAVLPANSGVSQRTGNPWMSQEYVIEVPGQYPRKCVFRVFGEDRIKTFNIQNGEDITVSFDIDAHEYNGRWFNQVSAYNITRANAVVQPAAPVESGVPAAGGSQVAADPAGKGDLPYPAADDLPF
ncbi:MAG: DUF3127 domain-containing protein [Prevotella sp.]